MENVEERSYLRNDSLSIKMQVTPKKEKPYQKFFEDIMKFRREKLIFERSIRFADACGNLWVCLTQRDDCQG